MIGSMVRSVLALLSILGFVGQGYADDQLSKDIRKPNSEYLLILEHSCIKHINAGRFQRALEVLRVANWQCANRQYIDLGDDKAEHAKFDTELAQAQQARAGKQLWACDPPPMALPDNKSDFYRSIGDPIMSALREIGVANAPAQAIVAQIILETGWGQRIVGNNLFNIKGSYHGQSVSIITHEQMPDGSWISIEDHFRKYPTIEESLADYLKVLRQKWPAAHAALQHNNIEPFLNGLRAGKPGGFATDQSYVPKLRTLQMQIHDETAPPPLPTYLQCLGRTPTLTQIMRRRIKWLP